MQELRERWMLDEEESIELVVSIFGRLMNEAAYALCGISLQFNMKIDEILPETTKELLTDMIINGKIVNPKFRKDIDISFNPLNNFINSPKGKDFFTT